TLLPNGKVLVTGGVGAQGAIPVYLSSAELYDPATNTWSIASAMSAGRNGHTATLLPNGKVLVTGGYNSSGYLSSAELYDPDTNTWSAAAAMSPPPQIPTATLPPNGKAPVTGAANSGGLRPPPALHAPAPTPAAPARHAPA